MARRLEGSARGALTAVVVPAASVPNAISVVTFVQMAGEVVAPILFAAVAAFPSLAPAFLLAALAYAPAALLPMRIKVSGRAAGAARAPTLSGWVAVASLLEGVKYIFGHPLLPGLYALDWGLTLFTFYRELFPFFVAALFTDARLGLSARQAAAALTVANYVGGTAGSSATLLFNSYAYKGRAVCLATLAYGASAALIGCSPLLPVGALFVALCGAMDAVGCAARRLQPTCRGPRVPRAGVVCLRSARVRRVRSRPRRMTFRKTVVLITTPDQLRGRAQAGHSLAANVANALGQMYVAAVGSAIGLPATMALGGALTWAAVGLALWRIPKLWSYHDGPALSVEMGDAAPDAAPSSAERRGKSTLLPNEGRS